MTPIAQGVDYEMNIYNLATFYRDHARARRIASGSFAWPLAYFVLGAVSPRPPASLRSDCDIFLKLGSSSLLMQAQNSLKNIG